MSATRLILDDREGNSYEIPHGKIQLKHGRNGRAGTMEFEYYGDDIFSNHVELKLGQVVRFEINEEKIFYGFIFKINKEKIMCYDQIRYLKFKDTKVFINKKASEIFETITQENKMSIGKITDTGYVIPKQVSDDKEYLDMIQEALQSTLLATGRLFFLQDKGGLLSLLDVADTKLDLILSGYDHITEYDIQSDIDSDTFNRIKLTQVNKNQGKRDIYIHQDSANMAKWGTLQYYETVDENLNPAQIDEKAKNLLELKNREKKTFSIKNAIGDLRCMAGYSVCIYIPEEKIENYYLINEDTHTFEGNDHRMDLELVVI